MRAILLLFYLSSAVAFAQQPTQTVRGKIFDSETQYPLVGAKVQVFTADSAKLYRALTNISGEFSIVNVPVGKHNLKASYLTYDTK